MFVLWTNCVAQQGHICPLYVVLHIIARRLVPLETIKSQKEFIEYRSHTLKGGVDIYLEIFS